MRGIDTNCRDILSRYLVAVERVCWQMSIFILISAKGMIRYFLGFLGDSVAHFYKKWAYLYTIDEK